MEWEQIQAIAERNAIFLDEQPEDFLNTDVKLTEEELVLLLWLLIDDFETEDGLIKKNNKNFLMVTRVDELFKDFALAGGFLLIVKLIGRLQRVLSNNFSYYARLLGRSEKFTKTSASVRKFVNRRLGLAEDGSMVKDGYVNTLYGDKTIRNKAREIIFRGVLSGNKPSDLKTNIKNYISGTEKTKGAIEKFYSQFAYDTFGQIDRMASVQFADRYGLQWFIYYGTLIATSRAFCRKHINGIYNVVEARNWIYQNPRPLGISESTYDPVIDMGGVNCRHTPFFLTEDMKDDLFNRGFSNVPSNL